MGLYPYFRAITSGQDTEVIVAGKKMIMVGSDNYLGLVNHPEVKEAMISAIEKYVSRCTGLRLRNLRLKICYVLSDYDILPIMRAGTAQLIYNT
jgi:7-keto-8-aminopelargonate synthetase-like enzyme